MNVSIIIVNYKSSDLVINCIQSILRKTSGLSYEIIVVDNASNDGSVEKLQGYFGSQISVVASNANLGFGKANNLGSNYATGQYIFLLNPDTILVNNAIKEMYDYMENNHDCGVVGGNLYMPDMTPAPSYCLKFGSLTLEKKYASWSFIVTSKIQQKIFTQKKATYEKSFNHTGEPIPVAYIFGADMFLKRSLFNEVGGFDKEFFMYAEEEELTWRITQAGYKVMNIPAAKIIHIDGATTKTQNVFSERQFRMRMNGALIYFYKRYGLEGAKSFYRYRTQRYIRLIKIARVQGKLSDNFLPAIQKKCLDEEYYAYISKV